MLGFVVGFVLLVLTFDAAPHQAQTTTTIECPPGILDTGEHVRQIASDRVRREYLLYIPDNLTAPAPLVIALHGLGSNFNEFFALTGWQRIADAHGVILTFPQGFRARWNAALFENDEIDDVLFIRDMLDELRDLTCYDAERVFVNGFSNGGGMTERIACAMADEVAAVGIVAGAVSPDFSACEAENPVPLIAFHGLRDSVVPYVGVQSGLFNLPPIDAWLASWAVRNGCDDRPQQATPHDGVEQIIYTDCAADVLLYTVEDGQHMWPGGEPPVVRRNGQANYAIDATATMWAFFVANDPLQIKIRTFISGLDNLRYNVSSQCSTSIKDMSRGCFAR